ncbi:hypothetical protein ACLIYM_00260 [Streptomyces fenghuangensis]|uniref:Uncharacterized protein n=2 Tax=Streptomyces TaxID=1883 RepID=A0A1I3ZSP8_9ACTN|nr:MULTISPECIES: hypothetical protein [Streptomyces]MBN3929546.1 hypothetical protein [Streptomyces verrucosisporus]MCG3041425.1 hypothetical protein [Streptomyces sp. ICN903]MCI0386375.1 hypothetical protein [Streptomyces sp. CNQ085]MDH2412009.1 hypothetical protein [Streptomyces chitinivorans]SFK46711.1 hypothetical protein SAMN05192584_106140 [Streptomyces pini]
MVLSISGVLLFGVIVFLFFRKDNLKLSHAIVCALFGFYLAGSAIAPGIQAGGDTLANLLGNIPF